MKTLVIIPAYNEQNTLQNVIENITNSAPNVDYVVVNDCSTDDSVKLLDSIEANYINCSVNLGIGGAVQAGYKYAYESGYDIAIQIDGDGQHDAAYINDIVRPIEDGRADFVIGSRFIEKEGFQSTGSRRAGIGFLSGLIFLMCGKKIKDVTSGYRAVNKQFIKLFAEDYPDDYPEPEVIVTATLYGGRIEEIPVIMRERVAGKSSINLKKSVYYMVKVSLAIIIRRISLGVRRSKPSREK